jgi:hypothetical protein
VGELRGGPEGLGSGEAAGVDQVVLDGEEEMRGAVVVEWRRRREEMLETATEEERTWVSMDLRRRSMAGAGDCVAAPPATGRFPVGGRGRGNRFESVATGDEASLVSLHTAFPCHYLIQREVTH